MMKIVLVALCLALFASSANGEYDYEKKNFKLLPSLTGATTCEKAFAGNTPALCPVSAGVPLTDQGKEGSTVCVTTKEGKSYEAVFSLMYPLTTAILGCNNAADCGGKPGIVCATNGPAGVGIPNTCFPLAPSGCPFTGDKVNQTVPAVAGRKFAF